VIAILFAILSLGAGVASFAAGNPAGLPVLGLAFGAAGALREYRGLKRSWVLGLVAIGLVVCIYEAVIAVRLAGT
jgi:hypothetical protein